MNLIFSVVFIFFVACPLFGQILPSDRSPSLSNTPWDFVGVSYNGLKGVPTFPDCTVALVRAGVGADIQSAIEKCPDRTTIKIPAGTYDIAGLKIVHPIVLRGAGAGSTILNTSSSIDFSPWYGWEQQKTINWTAGFTKGTTTLTLANVSGLAIGDELLLDQLNDSTLVFAGDKNASKDSNGNYITPVTVTGMPQCGRDESRTDWEPANNRCMQQIVRIKDIPAGTTQVVIDPPLFYTHSSSLSPRAAYWTSKMRHAGIENLTIDGTTMPAPSGTPGYSLSGVYFGFCTNCWAKGLEIFHTPRSAIVMHYYSSGGEIRDNYIHDIVPGSPGNWGRGYGIELGWSSNILVENNIVVGSDIVNNWATEGSVIAYNYIAPALVPGSGWMSAGIQPHNLHTHMNLIEGNETNQYNEENIYGSGGFNTLFRNRLTGTITGATGNTVPIIFNSHHRFGSVIGNILGTAGVHSKYEWYNDPNCTGSRSIFILAYWYDCFAPQTQALTDPLTYSSLLRKGNYDSVNACVWDSISGRCATAAEVASLSLPSSLYQKSRPQFFNSPLMTSLSWPAIGPDLAGSINDSTSKIPARLCYQAQNLAGGGKFSPDSCYSGSALSAPAAPTNLRIN